MSTGNTAAPISKIRFIARVQQFGDEPTREKQASLRSAPQRQPGRSFPKNLLIIRIWPRPFLRESPFYNFMIPPSPLPLSFKNPHFSISLPNPEQHSLKSPFLWSVCSSAVLDNIFITWSEIAFHSQAACLAFLLSLYLRVTPYILLDDSSVSTSKERERENVCMCVCGGGGKP